MSKADYILARRHKYMRLEGEYRIYAVFSDLKYRQSAILGQNLPMIPRQTEAEIEEYGHTQIILHFDENGQSFLSIEGVKEDEEGRDHYNIYFKTEIPLKAVKGVIERVGVHAAWYDDHRMYV
jgi:hypothetical protein